MYQFFQGPKVNKIPDLQQVANNLRRFRLEGTEIVSQLYVDKRIYCDSHSIILGTATHSMYWSNEDFKEVTNAFQLAGANILTQPDRELIMEIDHSSNIILELPLQINAIIMGYMINDMVTQLFSPRVFIMFRQMYFPGYKIYKNKSSLIINNDDGEYYEEYGNNVVRTVKSLPNSSFAKMVDRFRFANF